MICDICGKEYEHYGGIHEANMVDFRWMGFAHENVTVTRYAVCAECRDALHDVIEARRGVYEAAERVRKALTEMQQEARALNIQMRKTPPGDQMRAFLQKKYSKRE